MILLFTLLAITFAGPLIDFGSNEDSPFWMPAGVYSVDVTSIDELSSSSLELQLAPEDASIDCRWAAHLNGAKLTSGTISSESPVVVSINCISINGVSDTLQIGTEGCFLGRFAETKPKQTTSQDLFQTRCSPDSRKRDVQEIDDVDQAGSGNPKLVIPQLDPKIYNPTANLTWLAQVISQFSPETLAEFASTFTKWVRVDYFFNYVNNGTHAVTQATGITIVEKLDPPQKNGLSIFKWQNNGSHILVTNGDKSKLYAATEQFSGHPRGFFEQWNNGTYIIKFDGKKTELVPIPEKGTQWHPWRSNGTHSFFWDGFKTVITLLDPKEQVDASIIRWWNNGTHVFQTVVTDKRGDEKTTISLAQKEAEDYIFGGEGFEYPVFRWLKNQTHVIFFNGSYTRAAPFPKDLDKKSLLLTGFTFQRVPSPQFHISFHTKNETGVFNIKYPSLEWSVSLLGPPKIVTWNGTAFVPAIPGQPITHHRGNFTWINNGTYTTVYNDVLGDFVFKNNNGTHTFLFNGTDVIIRPISDGQHTQPSKKWTNNGTHILLFDGFGRFITAVRTDNGTHKFTFDGRSFNAVIHGGDPKKPSLIWTETATEIRFYKPQQAKFPKNNGTHTFHWDGSKFVVTNNVIVDGIDGALDPAKIVSWSDNGTHTTQSDGTKTVIIPDFNGTHHFTFNGKFWIITPDDGKKTTFWTDNGTHYIFHETNGTQTVLKNNGTHSWHYDGKSWTLQTNQEVFVRNWYNNGTHITVFETGKPDVIVVINNGTHITSYDGTKFSWKKNDFNIPSNVASTNPVLLKPEFIRSWTNNGTHITVSDGVLKFVIVINNGTFSRSFNGVKWSVSKNQPIPSAAEAQVDPTLIHGVKSWKSNGTHVTLSDGTREWVIKVENATHHRAYTGVKWVITKIDNIQFTPEQANKDPTILKGIRGWSDNGTVTILTDGTRTWVIQNSNATHSRSFNGHTWTIKKHPNQFTQDVANHNPGIITGITSWRSDGVHVTVSDGIHTFVITINNGTHIREFDGRKWNIHTNGASHGNSTHPQAPPKAGNQTHPNGTSHPQAPKHPQAPPKAANHSNGTSHPQAPPKAGNQTHPNGTSHAPTHVPPKAGNQTHPNGTSHPQAPPKHPQAPPKAANQTHPNGTSHPQAPKHPQAPPKAANHSNVTVPTLAQVEKDPTIFKAIKSWHIAGNKLTISDGQHSFVIDIQNATHTRHWDGKKWLITKNAPKVPTVHHNNGTNNSSVGLLNASDVQRDPTLITHVESWNDDGTITTISNGKQVFVIQNNNGTHRRQWNGSKWVITAFKVLSGADANKDPTLIQGIVSWHDDGTTTTVSDGKNTYTIQDTNATHTRHYDGAKWTITALTPKANLRETTTEPQPEPQPEPVPEATSVHSVEDSPSSGGSSPWIIPAVVGGTVAIVIILVVILIFVVYKKKTRII